MKKSGENVFLRELILFYEKRNEKRTVDVFVSFSEPLLSLQKCFECVKNNICEWISCAYRRKGKDGEEWMKKIVANVQRKFLIKILIVEKFDGCEDVSLLAAGEFGYLLFAC